MFPAPTSTVTSMAPAHYPLRRQSPGRQLAVQARDLQPEPPGGDVDSYLQPGLPAASACPLTLGAPGSYSPQSFPLGAPTYTSASGRAFPTQSRQEPRGQLSLHTWTHHTNCALNSQKGQGFGGSGVPSSLYPCLDQTRRVWRVFQARAAPGDGDKVLRVGVSAEGC